MQGLLARGIGIGKIDLQGNSPLHAAARDGNISILAHLWKYFSINALNLQEESPLHLAVKSNQDTTVRVLIENGANAQAKIMIDNILLDPLSLSVYIGARETCSVLIEKSNPRTSSKEQGNLLHIAIWAGQYGMLNHLLNQHHNLMCPLLEEQDDQERTPICLAAFLGDVAAIAFLCEKGANIEGPGLGYKRPLHWAALGKQRESVETLASFGCKLEPKDSDEKTPRQLLPEGDPLSLYISNLIHQSEVPRPFSPKEQLPENLVFSGGGAKGLGFVGVVDELERQKALGSVKRIVGTSAGAITATLLALGYTSQEIQSVLKNKPLLDFLDPDICYLTGAIYTKLYPLLDFLPLPKGTLQATAFLYAKLNRYLGKPKETLEAFSEVKTGICEGENFRKWIEGLIAAKIYKVTGRSIPYLTFGDLNELIAQGVPLKHLYVYATKVDSRPEVVLFSSEDPNCKDMVVSDVIRMSMAIPGVFKAHTIHIRENNQRVSQPKKGYFLDGGMLRNFPIETFDKKKYKKNALAEEQQESLWRNPRTWGFNFSSPTPPSTPKATFSITDLLEGIWEIYWNAESYYQKNDDVGKSRIINIDPKNVGTISFNLSKEEQKQLYLSGVIATRNFLADWKPGRLGKTGLRYDVAKWIQKKREGNLYIRDPHPDCIERPHLLQRLRQAVFERAASTPNRIKLLWGPGGVGKSELVIAFAHINLEKFSSVFFINYENESTKDKDYRAVAKALRLSIDKLPLQEVINRVHSHLVSAPTNKPWLLIFDNCSQKPTHLPEKGGCVLMTAREKFPFPEKDTIEIGPFEESEGVTLIKSILEQDDSPAMRGLVSKLHNYPLLINVAAHYIQQTPGYTLENYQDDTLNEEDPQGIYNGTLDSTFKKTLGQMRREYPLAVEALLVAAYLHPQYVPEVFVDQWLKGKKILNDNERHQARRKILRAWRNYGLINYHNDKRAFSLHRLFREMLVHIEKEHQWERLNEAIHSLIPIPPVSAYNPTHKETIFPFRGVLPHCKEALSFASQSTVIDRLSAIRLGLTVVRYYVETERNMSSAETFLELVKSWSKDLHHPFTGRNAFFEGVIAREKASETTKKEDKEALYKIAKTQFIDAHKKFSTYSKEEDLYRHHFFGHKFA